MQDLINRFKAIKEKMEEDERSKIQLQTKYDTHKENFAKNLKELKDKFGIESLSEAQEKLKSMELELSDLVDSLNEKMKPFEVKEEENEG